MSAILSLRDLAEERLALDDLLAMDEGEETPEAEALAMELAAQMVRKADAFGSYVREREATAAAIADEINRLTVRRKAITHATERLMRYAQMALEVMDRPRIEGTLFTLALQKNPPAVMIDPDTVLPPEYVRVVPESRAPDKTAIRDALKRGDSVPGCRLESTTTLRIK